MLDFQNELPEALVDDNITIITKIMKLFYGKLERRRQIGFRFFNTK